MKCETFRRRLLIDPNDSDPELQDHAEGCSGCADALRDALRFEGRLRTLLIAERDGADRAGSSAPGRSSLFAKAAWLFVPVLIAALWVLWRGIAPEATNAAIDWQDKIFDHIRAEEVHLSSGGEVPAARVRLLFASFGGHLDGEMGPVRYAGRCVIGQRDGIHLVLSGERGPVTALFMPGTPLDSAREIVEDGLQGLLLPAGFGNLAVVGGVGESVESMALRLLSNLDWAG